MKGPMLPRDEYGTVDYDSIPDVIQWFLDFDQSVALIKHPKVEELFQWKQEQSRLSGEEVFNFSRAEDRLAIGIIQSIAHNPTERDLHAWIAQESTGPVATARGSVTTPSGFSADESFSCIEELQTSCGVRRSARCFASLARV